MLIIKKTLSYDDLTNVLTPNIKNKSELSKQKCYVEKENGNNLYFNAHESPYSSNMTCIQQEGMDLGTCSR